MSANYNFTINHMSLLNTEFHFHAAYWSNPKTNTIECSSLTCQNNLSSIISNQSAESTGNSAAYYLNFILMKSTVWKYVQHL